MEMISSSLLFYNILIARRLQRETSYRTDKSPFFFLSEQKIIINRKEEAGLKCGFSGIKKGNMETVSTKGNPNFVQFLSGLAMVFLMFQNSGT